MLSWPLSLVRTGLLLQTLYKENYAPPVLVILHTFSIFSPLANQPESKVCVHGYLFPLPVALGPVPHPIYDATAGTEPVTQHLN